MDVSHLPLKQEKIENYTFVLLTSLKTKSFSELFRSISEAFSNLFKIITYFTETLPDSFTLLQNSVSLARMSSKKWVMLNFSADFGEGFLILLYSSYRSILLFKFLLELFETLKFFRTCLKLLFHCQKRLFQAFISPLITPYDFLKTSPDLFKALL